MSTALPDAARPPLPTAPKSCCAHCRQHRAALDAGLSAPALRMLSAIVLRTPGDTACSGAAAAAGLTPYQARPLLGELVRSGLLARQRLRRARTTVTTYSVKGAVR
ncbi:FaeA/PapI family transcriptional regulator [Streptomyces sp. MJM8645]|uniref:FaeA/PapI family transcriptional regulator n=1 Tax=Streptomycetaceae TaxID=2062 RepID=UPI0007AFC017|nr:FaeA/PapI family transcriptional regulator [Streptomyces sp. MJM8645]